MGSGSPFGKETSGRSISEQLFQYTPTRESFRGLVLFLWTVFRQDRCILVQREMDFCLIGATPNWGQSPRVGAGWLTGLLTRNWGTVPARWGDGHLSVLVDFASRRLRRAYSRELHGFLSQILRYRGELLQGGL
jgi:hypothetical protein